MVLIASAHPLEPVLTWRVLDVAAARHSNERASWHRPPHAGASGRAFIARGHAEAPGGGATGTAVGACRTTVRVIDRHPLDDWVDVSPAALRAQLARAYLPPYGWVERHGGTGVGWRRDRGAGPRRR